MINRCKLNPCCGDQTYCTKLDNEHDEGRASGLRPKGDRAEAGNAGDICRPIDGAGGQTVDDRKPVDRSLVERGPRLSAEMIAAATAEIPAVDRDDMVRALQAALKFVDAHEEGWLASQIRQGNYPEFAS